MCVKDSNKPCLKKSVAGNIVTFMVIVLAFVLAAPGYGQVSHC